MYKCTRYEGKFITRLIPESLICSLKFYLFFCASPSDPVQFLLLQFDSLYSATALIMPPPLPTVPLSLPFFSAVFFFHPCFRAPPTERPAHMSHQFMEIPIVFSHCAPLRGLWAACCSQHGLAHHLAYLREHNAAHALTFTDSNIELIHLHLHSHTLYCSI